jgi:hypothetical protein
MTAHHFKPYDHHFSYIKKFEKKKTLLGPCPFNGNIFRMHDPWLQNMPFQSGNGFHFAIP